MTEGDVTRSIILTRLRIVLNSEHDADVAVSLDDSSIDGDSEANQKNRPIVVRRIPTREE